MSKSKAQESKKQGKKPAAHAGRAKEETAPDKEKSSSAQLFFGASKAEPPPKAKAKTKPASLASAGVAIGLLVLLVGLLAASYRANQSAETVGAGTDVAPEKPKSDPPAQRPAQNPAQNPGAQAIQTAPTPPPRPALAPEDWNDAQIAWQAYDAGLAKAKAENRPVCLVFYTNWCPHCRNYSKVFHDPQLVSKAKEFVMIRINPDEQQAIGAKYAPDGAYVPRTYFLKSDGSLLADIHAPRPQYKYFYDENNPAGVLGGMEQALKQKL